MVVYWWFNGGLMGLMVGLLVVQKGGLMVV